MRVDFMGESPFIPVVKAGGCDKDHFSGFGHVSAVPDPHEMTLARILFVSLALKRQRVWFALPKGRRNGDGHVVLPEQSRKNRFGQRLQPWTCRDNPPRRFKSGYQTAFIRRKNDQADGLVVCTGQRLGLMPDLAIFKRLHNAGIQFFRKVLWHLRQVRLIHCHTQTRQDHHA